MRIELKESEKLYPLGTEDLDTTLHLTTWIGTGTMKWFFAVMVGDAFSRPYWDDSKRSNTTPVHKVLAIFDNKEEARSFMLNNIQPDIYLSFGWIITDEKENANTVEKK